MPAKLIGGNPKLSEQQLTLIEDFVADYNSIDRFFREALRVEESATGCRCSLSVSTVSGFVPV